MDGAVGRGLLSGRVHVWRPQKVNWLRAASLSMSATLPLPARPPPSNASCWDPMISFHHTRTHHRRLHLSMCSCVVEGRLFS